MPANWAKIPVPSCAQELSRDLALSPSGDLPLCQNKHIKTSVAHSAYGIEIFCHKLKKEDLCGIHSIELNRSQLLIIVTAIFFCFDHSDIPEPISMPGTSYILSKYLLSQRHSRFEYDLAEDNAS